MFINLMTPLLKMREDFAKIYAVTDENLKKGILINC